MTIIELNIAGYQVTHTRPDFRAFKANWLRGRRGAHRGARGRKQSAGPTSA